MEIDRNVLEESGLHPRIGRIAAEIVDFETSIVNHPRHAAAIERIKALHSRWAPPGAVKRLPARLLLVVGESGAGKSTVLEDYAARFPALRLEDVIDGKIRGKKVPPAVLERLRDGDILRVCLVEMPKMRMTERGFVAVIFQALGYRVAESWNTDRIIRQVAEYASKLGVELFLIDEGHHLVGKNGQDASGEIINFVKSLLNRLAIPIVIAGLPTLLVLQHDEDTGQVKRRGKGPVVLEPYDWWTMEGRTRVIALILKLEENLGLPEASNLTGQKTAARIYVAAAGEPGWMSKYLSEGLELALARGLPCLTLALLGEVHDALTVVRKPTARKLKFDEILGAEALAASDLADRQDNPFLCDFSALQAIWDRRQEVIASRRTIDAGQPAVRERPPLRKPGGTGSPGTGLRGQGRGPIQAFGKAG